MDVFWSARLKLQWSQHHLTYLKTSIQQASNTAHPGVVRSRSEDGRWWVFRLGEVQVPPPGLGLVAGDVAHSLRSSLEHAIWALVEANGRDPGGHSSFPVLERRRDWREVARPPTSKRRAGPLFGLTSDQVGVVREQQPFAWVEQGRPVTASPYFGVHRLWNDDKHRSVAAFLVQPAFGAVIKGPSSTTLELLSRGLAEWPDAMRIETGAEVLRVATVVGDIDGASVAPLVQYRFGDPAYDVGLDTFDECLASIEALLSRFEDTLTPG